MTTPKDLAIQKIEKEFEDLSNLILEQLTLLHDILQGSGSENFEDIFQILDKNEIRIDKYEVELEDRIIKAIVLYQPMAKDLRRLFSVYHMTINLERVGDLALKIAIMFNEIHDEEILRESLPTLQAMLKTTSKMVNRALLSFINNDQSLANWTIKKDATVDELNHKLLKRNIKAAGLPKKIQSTMISLVDVRSIISSIERIGDHATNVAEASIYAISGSNIRHKDLKND